MPSFFFKKKDKVNGEVHFLKLTCTIYRASVQKQVVFYEVNGILILNLQCCIVVEIYGSMCGTFLNLESHRRIDFDTHML